LYLNRLVSGDVVIERLGKKTFLLLGVEISLAICLIYTLFYLPTSLGFQYLVLSHRSMVEQTVNGSVLPGFLDVVVWGGCIFVVLAWAMYNVGVSLIRGIYHLFSTLLLLVFLGGLALWVSLVVFGWASVVSLVWVSGLLLGLCVVLSSNLFCVSRVNLVLRVLFGVLLFGLFIEVASFVLFNVPVALGLNVGALGLHWDGVELFFANLSYPFLPYVYLLFILFGVLAFVFRVFPNGWLWLAKNFRFRKFLSLFNNLFSVVQDRSGFLGGWWVVVLAVVLSSVVSCLFVLFTVLPWNNPTNMLVSVDSPVYYDWISRMRSVDVNSALSFALGNDRALFLVLCYVLSFFTSIVNVLQFVPAFLMVLLGIVSLLVLRLFSKDKMVWVFGVLLVPFSFQSLGLIYSGYFANMLALLLIFVYVVLFFKVAASWSILGFFALLSLSVLVLFSHSWTWFIFALSLCLFLFLQWRLATHDRGLWGRFKMQALIVSSTVGVGLLGDLMRKLLSPVSSTASVLGTAQSSIGLPNPAFLLSGMQHAVDITLGGVFASGLLVFLGVAGFIVLLRIKSESSSFFIAWICVACVSILFAANDLVFNRFLFMLPWVVLSGLGLSSIVWFVGSRVGGFKGWRLWVVVLVLGFVFLVLLNGSLRYLFNINIW